ncbi:multidrug efflux MFS transporter [Streptomyces sp. CT1-17]|uniref:MDR family MFS transporter n=1 Tax=Streptomyces sp. CT1-17 TaxID=2885642 RepID=UPI001D0F938D|nr:MDR family MFS transporter [Streptomyces sp. CT1-17]MCC2270707.1 multidrug efflux MFS transporter [Streptomyces sp. CT1-17]
MAQTQTGDSPPAAGKQRLPAELLKVAGVVLLGMLLMQFDGTMVSIALNKLVRELSVSVSTVQWVVTAYLLALMVGMPIAGWAADRFGTRTIWNFSLIGFLVGSLLCGLSNSVWMLIAARVVQGLGGGMMAPVGQAMLVRVGGVERRAQLVSLMAVPAVVGPTLGPVVGGIIVDDLSWRWMFFINLPIGLVAFLVAGRAMPNLKASSGAGLDVVGVALLVPGLVAIVYGLSQATTVGFGGVQVVVALSLGAAMVAGFAWHAARPNIDALVSMRLFRYRGFATSSILLLLLGLTMGAGFVDPLFLQQVHSESALGAGLLLVAAGVGSALASLTMGRVFNRVGPMRVGVAGLACALVGRLIFTQFDADTSALVIVVAMFVTGVGFGMMVLSMTTALYIGLPPEQVTRATSGSRIFQQIGLSAGTAVVGVVLQFQLTRQQDAAPGGSPGPDALAPAYSNTFWWSVAFLLLAVVPTVLLPKRLVEAPVPDKKTESVPRPKEA